MTTPQERFDEDNIKVIQFAFRFYYTHGTGNDPSVDALRDDIDFDNITYGLKEGTGIDILEDQFWEFNFKMNIDAIFKWNIFILTRYRLYNQFQSSKQDLNEIFDNMNIQFERSVNMNQNIGRYISMNYDTRYKDRIRQWAEDEYLLSPK